MGTEYGSDGQYRWDRPHLYEYQPCRLGGPGAYIHVGVYAGAKHKAHAVALHCRAKEEPRA